MGFRKYTTLADYTADPLALGEDSRVSLIAKGTADEQVKFDGRNIETTQPTIGDVVLLDVDNKIKFLKGGNMLNGNIPNGWTLVGFVFNRCGNKVKVAKSTANNIGWVACWQYAITSIDSSVIQIGLRMSNNYGAYTYVDVTLTSATINQTSANEISAAIAAKATEVGDTEAWWAWYDSTNGRIIVQTDRCRNLQQINITGTGCTIALCVFEDIPNSKWLLRRTLAPSDTGVVSVSKSVVYFGSSGATPSSNVAINSTSIVKKSSFDSSNYCAALRTEYGTYENYIAANKVKSPQKYGVFNLPDAAYMTQHYANATAPTKAGGTMYKFSALHNCATVSFNADGLRAGCWRLNDVDDVIELLDDDVLTLVALSQTKLNITPFVNTSYRWLPRMYSESRAWAVAGNTGMLYNYGVTDNDRAQAVCTLDLTQINQSNNS